MEINSKQEGSLIHYKDGEPVALTFFNGSTKIYLLKEPTRQEYEEFWEANKLQS